MVLLKMAANSKNRTHYHCLLCESADRHSQKTQHLKKAHPDNTKTENLFEPCKGGSCEKCDLPMRGRQLHSNWTAAKQCAMTTGSENTTVAVLDVKKGRPKNGRTWCL
jgi:hypothetical protein